MSFQILFDIHTISLNNDWSLNGVFLTLKIHPSFEWVLHLCSKEFQRIYELIGRDGLRQGE